MRRINKKANIILNLPQSNKSGTKINSIIFIIPTTIICIIAFSFDLNLVNIQIAITISANPISMVNRCASLFPKMPATIC